MKNKPQQINLYQSHFRKQKIVLSAWQVIRLSLALTAILATTSFYTHYQTSQLQHQVSQLTQQAQKLNTQVSAIGKLNTPQKHRSVEETITRLKKARNAHQNALNGLNEQHEYHYRFVFLLF